MRRRRLVRRVALVLLTPILIVAAWYGVSRAASPWRAVSVVRGLSTGPPTVAADGRIRVATWNIAHGRGGERGRSNWDGGTRAERRARLAAIAERLRELDADVVVLNEVDFAATWSHGDDQALFLARQAGYAHLVRQRSFDVALPLLEYRFGNAVLSRLPVRSTRFVRIPAISRFEAVVAGRKDSVIVELERSGGSTVHVWAVHLESRGGEDMRIRQVRGMLEVVPSIDGPLVIAGDLNSTARSLPGYRESWEATTAFDVLMDTGRFASFPAVGEPPHPFTFPSEAPETLIDWILVPHDWAIEDGAVVDGPLSDHLPVVATVSPPPRSP